MLDTGPNPVPEPKFITAAFPFPLRKKSCGSCDSGYTTLPKSIADEKILAHLGKNIKGNFYRRRKIIFEQFESKL